ncbi:DUF1642 domain-containing protein [Enterococcus faecium]|uniref:DUF1642 domain-containing protein n=1 Tax=Enterococcus faecium TaxID=1352 RepID=UPI0039A4D2B9
MNKLEAIKELEGLKTIGNDARAACYNEGINAGITIIKQLDEPQKPVVPKFVAEWFEDNKDNLEFAIWELCVDSYNAEAEPKIIDWIQCSENKPIETLIRMKDGYEVEKEPLYRVKLGEGYFVEYQGRGALIIPDDNKEIKIFDSKSDAERTAQTIGGTVEEVAE